MVRAARAALRLVPRRCSRGLSGATPAPPRSGFGVVGVASAALAAGAVVFWQGPEPFSEMVARVRAGVSGMTSSAPAQEPAAAAAAAPVELSAEDVAREDSLRIEIRDLVAELQERTKWEALRLHQLLQQVENETSAKYISFMEQEEEAAEQALAHELSARSDESARARDALMREKARQAQKALDEAIDAQEKEMRSTLVAELEKECAQCEEEQKQAATEHVEQFKASQAEATREREQLTGRLESDVSLVQAHITAQLSAERIRDRVNRISAAGMALVSQIETADTVHPQLVAMEHACAGDDIIMAAVTMIKTIEEQRAALPKAPSDPTGVPSLLQIQRRFQVVRAASWREILVPSGLRTIEGHLLGWLFSALRYPSSTSGGGSIAQEDRLVKASHLVRAGELGKAVALLESLEGPAAAPFRDWLVDARHRLVANQAGSLVRARVSLLNRSVL